MAAVLAYALAKVWGAYQQALKDNKDLQDKVVKILENAVEHDNE